MGKKRTELKKITVLGHEGDESFFVPLSEAEAIALDQEDEARSAEAPAAQ